MDKNYTVMFLMFMVASLTGGFAIQSVFEYAMIIGISLSTIFLLCAAYTEEEKQKRSNSEHE